MRIMFRSGLASFLFVLSSLFAITTASAEIGAFTLNSSGQLVEQQCKDERTMTSSLHLLAENRINAIQASFYHKDSAAEQAVKASPQPDSIAFAALILLSISLVARMKPIRPGNYLRSK